MRKGNGLKYLVFASLLLLASPAWAYVMSSTNYRIQRDSINFSGGLSDSASYSLESTLGESATGSSTASSYKLQAGYQQMDSAYITLTIPGSASLSPSIDANTGGKASTSAVLNVKTNCTAGYTMQIKASTSPALHDGVNSFNDYTPAGAAPDFIWTVAASATAFGYTPHGADIVTRYKNNGTSCNQAAGVDTSERCWDGLSTAYNTIAQSSSSNLPLGTDTIVKFQAEAGASAAPAVGTYIATIVLTAFLN